jgi:hypothetical protein
MNYKYAIVGFGAFVTSISDNTPHPVTGIDGLRAMQIDAAINLSHEQGNWSSPIWILP